MVDDLTPALADLFSSAGDMADHVAALRQDIHAHPELAFEEVRTSRIVADQLNSLGLSTETGVAETGVVATLSGGSAAPGRHRTVLLRADMDALPIEEETGLPFASRERGLMHACGHDAHTAILLGTAALLSQRRDRLAGGVVFMFQPAEEGGGGARRMVEAGVLTKHGVDVAYMLHVWHELPSGTVGIRSGPVMAGALSFEIKIEGKGGHAARPQHAVDPVVVGAFVITTLQTILSREVDPQAPAVLTIGKLSVGTAHNVIADSALIAGTARAYDAQTMDLLRRRIQEIAEGTAATMRARATVSFGAVYPPVVCDVDAVETAARGLRIALGEDAVREAPVSMGSEDFGYVLQEVPGAVIRLGVRDPAWAAPRPMHTATFDLDEDSLAVGVTAMAAAAISALNDRGPLAVQ
jgi:amidohydrolase